MYMTYLLCMFHTYSFGLSARFLWKKKRRVYAKISAVREGKTGGALHHRHRRHQPPHKRSWYFELSIHSKPSSTLTPVFFWRNLQRISWVYSPPMTNSLHTLMFLHMYLRYIVSRTHCTMSIQKTDRSTVMSFCFASFLVHPNLRHGLWSYCHFSTNIWRSGSESYAGLCSSSVFLRNFIVNTSFVMLIMNNKKE